MSTLNDFTPTTFDELNGASPDHVIDAYSTIERWTTTVELPALGTHAFVGDKLDGTTDAWVLYHDPSDPDRHGVAGVLYHQRGYRDDTPAIVAFRDAGDEPPLDDTDQQLVRVDELAVSKHTRTEELDSILDRVRTDITDTDWESMERGDTSVDEWYQALAQLADFRQHHYDTAPFLLPVNFLNGSPRVMHGIARYPMDGERFISHMANGVRNTLDNGAYDANPEAIRTLIADYATVHLDTDPTPSLGTM